MKFLTAYGLILASSIAVAACAASGLYSDGPFRGKVVDAETRQPLEGTVVLAVWYKIPPIGGPGGPRSQFYDAQEVLTDAGGEFTLSGVRGFFPLSEILGPVFIIFKPGYGSFPRFAPSNEWKDRLVSGEYVTIGLVPARTPEMRRESASITTGRVPDEKMPELLRLLRIDREKRFPKQ